MKNTIAVCLAVAALAGCYCDVKNRAMAEVLNEAKREYLALATQKHRESIDTFNQLFDAEQFRHRYYIRAQNESGFSMGPLDSWPEFQDYSIYVRNAALFQNNASNVYRFQQVLPLNRANVAIGLEEGFRDFKKKEHIRELEQLEAIVAAMRAETADGVVRVAAVAKIRGDYYAIGTLFSKGHEDTVVDVIAELARHSVKDKQL